MSRPIRFRAWDGQEMLDDWLVLKNEHGAIIGTSLTRKAISVMQFTGLHDKNGKEIYEGDILEWYNALVPKGTEPIQRIVVEWDESQACFEYRRDAEVIGNIYENPDLLK